MAGLPTMTTEVIQHIQSFLTRREARRTTILSKQWYTAWLTNGLLYLDPQGIGRAGSKPGGGRAAVPGGLSLEFQNFATTSINRYKDMNLVLHELRLWMYIRKDDNDHEATARFYDQLILDALSLGVTVIHLIVKGNSSDYYYTLPPQVFNSVSLEKLYLDGHCRIGDLTATENTSICSSIVSLKLVQVKVGDDTIRDILLRCSLIQDLTLNQCKGLAEVNLSVVCGHLKTFSARFYATRDYDYDIDGEVYDERMFRMLLTFGTEDDQYPNLISLKLDRLRADDLFSDNFSDRFPCLEKLKLKNYKGPDKIEISSNSVKCLSLNQEGSWLTQATIDLPNISNFNLRGDSVGSLVFRPPGDKWTSSVELSTTISCTWLRNILTGLRSSEISLAIDTTPVNCYGINRAVQTINLPEVENLSIKFHQERTHWRKDHRCWMSCCERILCVFLFHCSPKFITPTFEVVAGKRGLVPNYKSKELLYKMLKKHVNMKKCLQTFHGENCIHGLKEVQVEIYDQTLSAWKQHPNPDKAWTPESEGDEIRFSLKWN